MTAALLLLLLAPWREHAATGPVIVHTQGGLATEFAVTDAMHTHCLPLIPGSRWDERTLMDAAEFGVAVRVKGRMIEGGHRWWLWTDLVEVNPK